MEIIKKSLTKKEFESLFKNRDLISDQQTISDKAFDSRYEVDGCKFLFVKNDNDGLIYCYFKAETQRNAVLISKSTLDNALNIYKGSRFLKSANISEKDSALVDALSEMQRQPEFMQVFATAAKTATAEAQALIAPKAEPAKEDPKTIQVSYVSKVNQLIGENMKKLSKKNSVESLKEQRSYLVEQRDNLVEKLADLKAKLEDEQAYASLLQSDNENRGKEVMDMLAEATLYIEQKEAAERELDEVYKNYQALGLSYEALEAEKKALENDNKWLGKQLGKFSQDFQRMSLSNGRNRLIADYASAEVEKLQKRLEKNQVKTQVKVSALRKERNAAYDRISALQTQVKAGQREYARLHNADVEKFEEVFNLCNSLTSTVKKQDRELLELMEAYMLVEEENVALKEENASIKLKKAERIAADVNENETKVYRLTGLDEEPVFLAVGPHYNKSMRRDGKTGRDYQTLYMIKGGDPTRVLDANGNIMAIEDVLVDENLRSSLDIHGVNEIKVGTDGKAKIYYYDRNRKGEVSSDYIKEVKDVEYFSELSGWVERNYGVGKVSQVKVFGVSSKLKTPKVLKAAAIIAAIGLTAGAATFAGFKGWGGPNEIEKAKETGRKQISAFVDGLAENQTLFQYTPALDEYGNRIKYVKTVSGQEVAVSGNSITAIGNANRVFYNEAEGKVVIDEHKQQNFWGKLKNYKEETIEGAAYQLGAEVVEELSANNVPVYSLSAKSSQKQPLYVYLNFAAENSDYSSRSAMLAYLKSNGYSANLAEKITTAYEEGFVSGLENGLSNKVEQMIGKEDVVTPEVPPVEFTEVSTKTAISNKVAATTLQGKKYSADELHVVYSDLDTDGEQVLFVMANKEGQTGVNANKYLYKIVLGDGATQIDSTNVNEAINNAETVTESIRLDFMFKNEKYKAAVDNFNAKNEEGSIAYVSNYALTQDGNSYSVTPTLTIYNDLSKTVTEESAKYSVKVKSGETASSVTAMCAVALLGDYGFFDENNLYSAIPVSETKAYSAVYADNGKELE